MLYDYMIFLRWMVSETGGFVFLVGGGSRRFRMVLLGTALIKSMAAHITSTINVASGDSHIFPFFWSSINEIFNESTFNVRFYIILSLPGICYFTTCG